MPKVYVRDDAEPATIYNPRTETRVIVFPGAAFDADDPFVADHRDLFGSEIEQATAAPGEKRNARRSKSNA